MSWLRILGMQRNSQTNKILDFFPETKRRRFTQVSNATGFPRISMKVKKKTRSSEEQNKR